MASWVKGVEGMPDRIRPELLDRFGHDPDALEWARGVVQEGIDLLEATAALPEADDEQRKILGFTIKFLRERFIGIPAGPPFGFGVYGVLDARLAEGAVRS